jgi:hypothetical protein
VAPLVPPKPAQVKKEIRPKKTFPSEVPQSFEELSNQYRSSGFLSKGLGKALVILAQPVLGALPHDTKKQIEAAVQSPWFTVAGSTGLNIVHNAVIYPVVCMIVAVILHGPAILFSQEINNYILVGLFLAVVEGISSERWHIACQAGGGDGISGRGLWSPAWTGFAAHFGKTCRCD